MSERPSQFSQPEEDPNSSAFETHYAQGRFQNFAKGIYVAYLEGKLIAGGTLERTLRKIQPFRSHNVFVTEPAELKDWEPPQLNY